MNTIGAHEAMELHEVLNDAIHGLNTLRLFRPHAKEPQLQAIMDRHMSALTMDYNNMVLVANPTLRRMMQQSANASADMAYEGFQYANQMGYYQVPTLRDTTQHTYMGSYGTVPMTSPQAGAYMM